MSNLKVVHKGRTPGALDKNKQFLLNRLKAEYGDKFDPMMTLVDLGMGMLADIKGMQSEIGDKPTLSDYQNLFAARSNAATTWEKVAQYTTPKLKAQEVSPDVPETQTLSSEQLKARLTNLVDKLDGVECSE